ncbi:hypothetical protein [Echinicola vietnamensis]|uniref:SD-repeat containing protein B domain-containing protein n=1 Tax=Echinicola vietnamensis (strain DSM 17526 / LMG 23754 / KMM 6221) TaxID=926556 RepID=L0FVP6_ECHVK|nr:hypothetical protein [Echinicola vietnamensis]AGA77083.1 hypothetical protein Echvi_0808 [Echinicola vietnamensis DSM 17526]
MKRIFTLNFNTLLFRVLFLQGVLLAGLFEHVLGEGSGDWGTASDRRSWLWIPANSSNNNGGYGTRGYMMMPSSTNNYNPDHRMYVYVKPGETVYWGFRNEVTYDFLGYNYYNYNSDIRVRWFYDDTDTGFFPDKRYGIEVDNHYYDAHSNEGIIGRPANAQAAANGPSDIVGPTGYEAYSFTNNTGEARAFWVEISRSNGNPIGDGLPISIWDVTVANSADEVQPGRLYSKYWSILNGLPRDPGVVNDRAFHDNFGFYVPVDDTFGGTGDTYFVKHAQFPNSNGGFVNFFANQDGPRNDTGNHVDNRKSIEGASSNYQYPLFLNDPDLEFWPTTVEPTASLDITYEERVPTGNGGHAWVDINISLPGIVDVLIDLNGNGTYDGGIDLIMSEKYDASGEYTIYWDGKDANENVVTSGSKIGVFAAVIFSPVHFPIYDMEQSMGITITNVRPGDPEDNTIYWDDSLIPRDGEHGFEDLDDGSKTSAVSLPVNVTGEAGDSHIWYGDGNNGFSERNTINTWAASYYAEVNEDDEYRYLTFQGNVYDDDNGGADGLIFGQPTTAEGLHVLIVDENEEVVATEPVAADGTYFIDRVPDGTYRAVLSSISVAPGDLSPGPILPEHWENTGAQLGTNPDENLYEPTGILGELSLNNSSVRDANFGLRIMAVLPVVWQDFNVTYQENQRAVALEWTVSKEWENSHYEVERSQDGVNDFQTIAKVAAAGWTDEITTYQFLDEKVPLPGGKYYYRIKQVNLDNSSSYGDLRQVTVPKVTIRNDTWRAYPNPGGPDDIKLELLDQLAYNGGQVSFRAINGIHTMNVNTVNSPEELSQKLSEVLHSFGTGLVIVEVTWENKAQYIKVLLR